MTAHGYGRERTAIVLEFMCILFQTAETRLMVRGLYMSLFSVIYIMSRSPFSSVRDTLFRRRGREAAQLKVPTAFTGTVLCDTEVGNARVPLPVKMVFANPAIFRPVLSGPGNTYHIDMVFQKTEYPIVCIENKPRLAKFQPEVRVLLRPDGSAVNGMCRTASNTTLGSHSELKKQLKSLVGKGAVGVNLTPHSAELIVAVVGIVSMHIDGFPIVSPIKRTDALPFLRSFAHPLMDDDIEKDEEKEEETIYVASILDHPTVPDTPPFSLKRSRPCMHKKESTCFRLRCLPRKGPYHRNHETRRSKIRRLANMKSVDAQ